MRLSGATVVAMILGAAPYTHSSTVKTMQEIFGIGAALGDSASATDLADLFTRFP